MAAFELPTKEDYEKSSNSKRVRLEETFVGREDGIVQSVCCRILYSPIDEKVAVSLVSVCPHCGEKYKFADDSKVGKKIRCRECEEPFAIKPATQQTAKKPSKRSPGGLPPRTLPAKSKPKKKSKPAETDSKKPGKKSPSSAGRSPALIGGVSVLGLGLLIGVPLLMFSGEKPMEPPASYAAFQHDNKEAFKCEYPEGWSVESGGTGGSTPWAKFEQGDVKIRVRSSMGASAIGDISKNLGGNVLGDAGGELDEELAPVANVHNLMKDQFAQDYGEYQESGAETIKSGFGDTRVSEFTASGSWGGTIRGMRASMLGLNLQFTVICDCPEDDWEVCRPIFERVIKSMSRG